MLSPTNPVVLPCPLNLQHVQQYIRSKGADDVIGTQGNSANTLVSEVWYFHHGLGGMAVVRSTGFLEVGDTRYELSEELWAIHLLFERLQQWGNSRIDKKTWVAFARLYWAKTIMTIGKDAGHA